MTSPSPEQLTQAIEQDFSCARCGHCCKGDGIVQFGPREAESMAAKLEMPQRRFLKEFAIRVDEGNWMLRDRMVAPDRPGLPKEQWCIFLERDRDGRYGCRVDSAKPDQCRSFPHQWRNPDSTTTCAGLRLLLRRMRETQNRDSI